jgi:hypothetical protein
MTRVKGHALGYSIAKGPLLCSRGIDRNFSVAHPFSTKGKEEEIKILPPPPFA